MYDFKDLNSQSTAQNTSSFGLIYDTVDLENEVSGFRTLSVTGRGLLGREISTMKVPVMDGVLIDESKLPSRTLNIKYKLQAATSSDLRRSYEKLNRILHSPSQVKLSFKDEAGRYYFGFVSDISDDEEISNNLIGEIRIFCPKPYLYSDPVITAGPSVTFGINPYTFKLLADFSFIPTASAGEIQIKNVYGDSITIGPVVAGRQYDLILSENKILIKENGIRKMTLLSIQSGLENFRIQPGIPFSLSTGGILTATFVELRL